MENFKAFLTRYGVPYTQEGTTLTCDSPNDLPPEYPMDSSVMLLIKPHRSEGVLFGFPVRANTVRRLFSEALDANNSFISVYEGVFDRIAILSEQYRMDIHKFAYELSVTTTGSGIVSRIDTEASSELDALSKKTRPYTDPYKWSSLIHDNAELYFSSDRSLGYPRILFGFKPSPSLHCWELNSKRILETKEMFRTYRASVAAMCSEAQSCSE